MKKNNAPSGINRIKNFISPLSGRSVGIEDSRPLASEDSAKQAQGEAAPPDSAPAKASAVALNGGASDGVTDQVATGNVATDKVTTDDVAVKGVKVLPPDAPLDSQVPSNAGFSSNGFPPDFEDLMSADGASLPREELFPSAPYSAEVLEALQEMPQLPDIDMSVVPSFYVNGEPPGRKRDDTEAEAASRDNRAFEELLKNVNMANVNQSLSDLMAIDGAMAVAVVDYKSGMMLGSAGGGLNLDVAAAGNSEVVKTKMKVMGNLGLKENIEDILITLGSQYHLIRPMSKSGSIFIYLVLNKAQSNLAMARFKLTSIEAEMEI